MTVIGFDDDPITGLVLKICPGLAANMFQEQT